MLVKLSCKIRKSHAPEMAESDKKPPVIVTESLLLDEPYRLIDNGSDYTLEMYVACDDQAQTLSVSDLAAVYEKLIPYFYEFSLNCGYFNENCDWRLKATQFTSQIAERFNKIVNSSLQRKNAELLQKDILGEEIEIALPIKTASDRIDEFNQLFPKHELWRFFVDGHLYSHNQKDRDSKGWRDYEAREPGCLKNAFHAWEYLFARIESNPGDKSINLDLIQRLHDLCTGHLDTHNSSLREDGRLVRFGFPTSCLHRYSKVGVANLFHAMNKDILHKAKLVITIKPNMEELNRNLRDRIYKLTLGHRDPECQNKRKLRGFSNETLKLLYEDHAMYLNKKSNGTPESNQSNQLNESNQSTPIIDDDIITIQNILIMLEGNMPYYRNQIYSNNASFEVLIVDHEIIDAINKCISFKKEHFESLVGDVYDAIATDEYLVVYFAPVLSREEQIITMEKIITNYNTTISACKSSDEILDCIGSTIQQFELLHPFMDGNGRTFVNLLLNYMLITSGLPPAIFFEPNVFDIHDKQSLAIKAAIQNTLKLYSGNQELFGFKNLEGPAKDEMLSMIDSVSNITISRPGYTR